MGFKNRISKIFKSKKENGYEYLNELVRHGNDVVLDSNMRYGVGENYWLYNDGIYIKASMTIDGNGYSINAQRPDGYKYHVFVIKPPFGSNQEIDVVIKNITIENASYDDIGAICIYEGANVTIRDSFFNGNDVAIFNKGGNLTLVNCELNNNSRTIINNGQMTIEDSTIKGNVRNRAISNGGEATIINSQINANDEGAILNSGEMSIDGSHISNNNASAGGAIENNGKLTISSSELFKNTSEQNGGAIENNGRLALSSSTFSKNTAALNGGAINNLSNVDITDCTFLKNCATDGGALFNRGGCEIEECSINENNGCRSVVFTDDDALKIRNTTFKSNNLKDENSNVIVNMDKAYVGIFDSKFIDNNAVVSVIYNAGEDCTISKTLFENNLSSDGFNIHNSSDLHLITPKVIDKGKNILNYGYISIKNADENLEDKIDNHGTVEPVGKKDIRSSDFGNLERMIHESDTKEIVLTEDIVLKKYEVDFYEGGIEIDIDGLTIDGNGKSIDGAGKSRIFLITADDVTLKNITFKNGYSHKNYKSPINENGGSLQINNDLTVTIENCLFTNNTAGSNGGAINNRGTLILHDSEFSQNSSKNRGGAIHNKGTLTLKNTTLSDNSAKTAGAIQNSNVITVSDSTFSGNFSKNGGAIHSSGKTTITKSKILANCADTGGGITQDENGDMTIDDTKLCNNTAKENGGAISNNGKLIIKDTKFSKNESDARGGAIHNTGELFIIVSIFSANSSAEWGGAIANTDKLDVMNSTFSNNNAEQGSAIYNYGEQVNISDSNFIRNINSAIFNYWNMKIDNSIFSHNSNAILNYRRMQITNSTLSDNTGRAIDNDGELSLKNSMLSNNCSERGGGAISNSSHLSIVNCDLLNNKAKRGGAIINYNSAKNLDIENSTFSNNKAMQGGAIYATVFFNRYIPEEIFIRKSTFTNNSNGAIECVKYNIDIKECTFENNPPKDVSYIEVKDPMGF